MALATVTSKGQITIPLEVRKALGLQSGTRVNFVLTDWGSYDHTVRSIVDCLIAAIAIRDEGELLHNDADYDMIAQFAPLRVAANQ